MVKGREDIEVKGGLDVHYRGKSILHREIGPSKYVKTSTFPLLEYRQVWVINKIHAHSSCPTNSVK